MKKILIVEKETELAKLIKEAIEVTGQCTVIIARSIKDAKEAIADTNFDAYFWAGRVSDGETMDLIIETREKQPHAYHVAMSMSPELQMEAGCQFRLQKPFHPHQLAAVLAQIISESAMVVA